MTMESSLNSTHLRRSVARAIQITLALGAVASAASALAAGNQSIVSVKVDPLPLYASPAAAQPASSTHASGLPWTVLESRDDFYRVKIDGKDYWIDSMTVHANLAVKAACERSAGGAVIAADLGASTNRCR
jgi:SH3-like domain-containing protein